jgi:hypothetical protein
LSTSPERRGASPRGPGRTAARVTIVTAVVASVLLGCGGRASADDADGLPYTLAVRVDYGEPKGPAVVREEVRRRTLHEIDSREWFEDVRVVEGDAVPDTDLLLDVRLEEYEEETVYETSMAARLDPENPEAQKLYRVVFSTIVRLQLILVADGQLVRSRHFRAQFTRSPAFVGEDLEHAVRAEAIREIADGIRRIISKGRIEKLRRRIEALRAEASSDAR